MTIFDINNYSVFIIGIVFTLCYAVTFIFAFWNHSRENPSGNISLYLINYKSILIYVSGLIITIIAMSEFIPFHEQRLKIFGLLLLLSSLHYIFNTLFYRIDIKTKKSILSVKKLEHLLNELDNQIDKASFSRKICNFLESNYHVDKFLMMEITEDIIPFTPIHHKGIDPSLFKELKIYYEPFYNAISQAGSDNKNILDKVNNEIKNQIQANNIQQILPLIHQNKPVAVILFGTEDTAYKKSLEKINWRTFIIQCTPRFELIRLIEREINIQKMAELGVMSSQLAHDFKSFLAMINLYMEDNPIIIKHVRYMNKLVKDLSAYARSTTSEKTHLNINEIIDLSLESTPIPENISIDKHLDKVLPPSLVDPHQMQRIFQNLIENSVRAMPEGGQIKVSTRTLRAKTSNDRPWVYIEFKDEGPGIPEENLQKIFEPFYTTYKKEGGTGMGLAISRQIIMHHQGFIDVTSKTGKGTIFNIRLPGIVGENNDK